MNKALKVFLGLIIATMVALFILHPPFWSHMDDIGLTLDVQKGSGLRWTFEQIINYCRTDLLFFGTFRPIYATYIYTFFKLFGSNPVVAYAILMASMGLLCFFWARVYRRLSGGDSQDISFYLFLVMCFAFTPHLQLFFYLSIQEKFVAVFNLVALIGFVRYIESGRGVVLMVAGALLSFFSKSTGLFVSLLFTTVFLLDFVQRREKKSLMLMGLFLVIAAGLGAFALSIRGVYSGSYQPTAFAAFLPQLHKKAVAFVGFAVLVMGMSMAANLRGRRAVRRLLNVRELIWPLGFLIYLLLLLPWPGGTRGYYLTGASFFFVGTMALFFQLVLEFRPGKWTQVALTILIGLLLVNRAVPARRMFVTRSGERDVIDWIKTNASNLEVDKRPDLFMPAKCQEASFYFALLAGSGVVISATTAENLLIREGKETYLLTSGECPADGFINFDLENPVFSRGDLKIFPRRNDPLETTR